MTAVGLLGVDEVVIDLDLKGPFGAGNELKIFNDVLIVTQDILRRTDGTG